MPRTARVVVPDWPHHVTQRGNNKQDVFFADDDRRVYLKILREQSRKHGLVVLGWCLMTNHVHLVTIPERADSLAKALGRTHLLYAQYVNRLHARSGHLWQNRFYSVPFEFDRLWLVMRYVERNPLRAHICRRPWLYPWSSAAAHCGMSADTSGLLDLVKWESMLDGLNWRASLSDPLDDRDVRLLRSHTHSGRPLASDGAINKLEKLLGRRLRPLPSGRPKKRSKK